METKGSTMILKTFCEYTTEPICVQNKKPRFSWKIEGTNLPGMQTSFRILVSRSEQLLLEGQGDCWDSGTVLSPNSCCVEYDGIALESKTQYFWTVELQCGGPAVMIQSPISLFETGIFSNGEWMAEWIESPDQQHGVSTLFRKPFYIDAPVDRARIYLCGLGYNILTINGKKVGDRVLEPGFTNYNKRVLYSVYDIADQLLPGDNVIGVELGEGWFGHRHESISKYTGGNPVWFSEPKLLLETDITLETGEELQFVSDKTFECSEGAIRENSIYNGEMYDARKEQTGWSTPGFNPAESVTGWKHAVIAANPPKGVLTAQIMPPIRVTEELKPVFVKMLPGNRYCYDFGQNFAGWAQVVCNGTQGSSIRMKYGETAREDGSVNQGNLREAKSENTYILNGSDFESYEPRFTYHGFRYVEIEITGDAVITQVMGKVVHTDVKQISRFRSTDEVLNAIYRAMIWTERSNMHSIPTDCPQRDERMAWLNDMTVRCTEALYNFDLLLFYEKWLADIVDEQNETTGSIPDTAPIVYGGNPSYHVSSCLVIISWLLYLHYGDKTILDKYYTNMKHYVGFLDSQTRDGLIGEPYYGEWAPPAAECMEGQDWNATPKNIPPSIITTGYLYYDCMIMEKAALLLGHEDDVTEYRDIRQKVKTAINEKYFNSETSGYGPNNQGSNIFPLFLDLVEKDERGKVLENLLHDLVDVHDCHITTGNQMTKYLFEVLQMEDRNDIALNVARSKTYPSLGYMIGNGATTLWERWENLDNWGMNSHNHPMNGAYTAWLFKDLGGIKLDQSAAPLETITLKPAFDLDLEFLEVEYESAKGLIQCNWNKKGDTTTFHIRIPWNMKAELILKSHTAEYILKPDSVDPSSGNNIFNDKGQYCIQLPAGEHEIKLVKNKTK